MPLGRGGGVNSVYPRACCTLPSFARIKGPRTHGKMGDCEQSITQGTHKVLSYRIYSCIMRTFFPQNEHLNTRCVLYTESFV